MVPYYPAELREKNPPASKSLVVLTDLQSASNEVYCMLKNYQNADIIPTLRALYVLKRK